MNIEEETEIVVAVLKDRGVEEPDVELVRLLLESHTLRWAYVKYLAIQDGMDPDLCMSPFPRFGDTVRITIDEHYLQGTLMGGDGDELAIQTDKGLFTLARAKILSVQLVKKNQTIRDNLMWSIINIEEPIEEEETDG